MRRKILCGLYDQEKAVENRKIVSEYFGYTFTNDSPVIEDEENFAYAKDDYLSEFRTVKVASFPELLWNE